MDVTSMDSVRSISRNVHTIVHLAARTDVDACAQDPVGAITVNRGGTENIVSVAAEIGARVIFVSTEQVFDGTKTSCYSESDALSPINYYGRSKALAEGAALGHRENLVVRSSWLFGATGDFPGALLDRARRGSAVQVVGDQRGRPTSFGQLAAALAHLVPKPDVSGVLHVAGTGPPCTRAELARSILSSAGRDSRVEEVDTLTYVQQTGAALRPLNGVLCIERAETLSVPLSDWRTEMVRYVQAL